MALAISDQTSNNHGGTRRRLSKLDLGLQATNSTDDFTA
jgi:hypothetical protein